MNWTIIAGTNRKNSRSSIVARKLESDLKAKLASGEKIEVIDLAELPTEIFHPEAYASKPESFKKFETSMLNSHALISVVPEYNGSFPGAFKYFLDMLPFPQSLSKVPAAFIGISAGRFGALRAVEQVEQVFQYRHSYLFPKRVFISSLDQNLDEKGNIKDAFLQEVYADFLSSFIEFAEKLKL